MVLLCVVAGSAAGHQPVSITPVTGFRPVEAPEATQSALPVETDPEPSLPSPSPLRASERPRPTHPSATAIRLTDGGGSTVRGVASWYCKARVSRCTRGYPPGSLVAAIRRDLLGHRGDHALVCLIDGSRCVRVRIVDCNCGPNANLIDLYAAAFERLGPTSRGVLSVTVSW